MTLEQSGPSLLSDFYSDLTRVEQLFDLMDALRLFAGSSNAKPVDDQSAIALRVQTAKSRTDLPIIANALLLYLCGRFENFVRDLVELIVDDIVETASSYEDLPEALRQEHVSRTLEIFQRPSKFRYDATEAKILVSDLASSLDDSTPAFRLKARVVTITDSNLQPEVLAELMKRVAINDLWSTLGKQLALKTHLGVGDDKACTIKAKARLTEAMRDRNQIAHPTAFTTFLAPDSVRSYLGFFKVLSSVLTDLAILARTPGL